MDLGDLVGSFFITLASIMVMGVTVLLIIYKMIDKALEVIPGLVAIAAAFLLMALSIKPPHPMVPAIAFVVVITLVAFFPYGVTMLESADLHAIEIERLEKAYNTLALKPDNVAAMFELAKALNAHGLKPHAISIASAALATLSTEIDQVGNRSVRDLFRNEELMLLSWQRELAADPERPRPLRCRSCGTLNEPGPILCSGCGEPYLLYIVRGTDIRPAIANRLVIAWAAVAVFFVGFVAIALNFEGVVRMLLLVIAFVGVGLFLSRLFRKPDMAAI